MTAGWRPEDITKRCQGDTSEFLLIVGTSFGCFLYSVLLGSERGAGDDCNSAERDTEEQTPVSRVHDKIAVCLAKVSSDGHTVAIGTMDGRLFLRRLDSHENDVLATFGTSVLSRVLIAPRITSMSFSACNTKLVIATRKGNVYVFACSSETGEWQMLPSCKDLSANPKPKAGVTAGVNKTATAAQTLVVCWGPVLVVCSRAVASRVELYDFESGSLLHTLQLVPATPNAPAAALNQWLDQQLVTGVCSAQLTSPSGYSSRLLCHDTSANIAVVEWPFLDVIVQRRRCEGFKDDVQLWDYQNKMQLCRLCGNITADEEELQLKFGADHTAEVLAAVELLSFGELQWCGEYLAGRRSDHDVGHSPYWKHRREFQTLLEYDTPPCSLFFAVRVLQLLEVVASLCCLVLVRWVWTLQTLKLVQYKDGGKMDTV
ncbi:WD40/YVTN repeat-like-containing domain [Phytophthora cactorum]|nr:WD40/YVTN repeat-like-containing domain [Phytophthora cactorum]